MKTARKNAPSSAEHVEAASGALQQEVQRVLLSSGYPEFGQIQAQVCEEEVALHGSLPSYFQKQVLQELVKRIPGVKTLQNEVTVIRRR